MADSGCFRSSTRCRRIADFTASFMVATTTTITAFVISVVLAVGHVYVHTVIIQRSTSAALPIVYCSHRRLIVASLIDYISVVGDDNSMITRIIVATVAIDARLNRVCECQTVGHELRCIVTVTAW